MWPGTLLLDISIKDQIPRCILNRKYHIYIKGTENPLQCQNLAKTHYRLVLAHKQKNLKSETANINHICIDTERPNYFLLT